ncbi:hypothetical protein D9M68_912830 [compost metagenome]
MHQVAFGAGPEAGGVPLQVVGEVGLVDHGAVDHVTGHARRVVHVLSSHHRLAAVGADQRLAHPALTVLVDGGHGLVCFVLLDLHDAGAGEERDAPGLDRAFQQ